MSEAARTALLTLFLMNFRALLSLDTFSSSIARLSYGAKPQTSRIVSRINLLCLVKRCNVTPNCQLQTKSKAHLWKSIAFKNLTWPASYADTYPASAAVFWSSNIFGYWMTFVEANSHGITNSHVCKRPRGNIKIKHLMRERTAPNMSQI